MIMSKLIINGIFYNHKLTGIERFAYEMTLKLDSISKQNELSLILPSNAPKQIQNYKNIYIKRLIKTPLKKQFNNAKLNLFILFHHCNCLDYGNNCPIFGKNIVFLHDIYCKVFPEDFRTPKDIAIMKKACNMYKRIAKKAKIICTVSEYSKKQIMEYYKVPSEKIHVIYDSVNYMKNIKSDYSILDRIPEIKNKPFYFTLGSLSLRKNLKWIVDHAELYPNELFVISGTVLKNVVPPELEKIKKQKNVICAGYLSDEEIKALYEKCKAFVFPSYFEGFGIPPLEALYCGAKIIISNASCLPEIYGNTAHYIDPQNPNINLDKILEEKVESPEKLFKKYSLDNSAKKLYELLKENK